MKNYELDYDRKLKIRTIGIREWKDEVHYNRCEPTPFHALDTLFSFYTPPQNSQVVDFGCGRGRVAFYIHNRFDFDVTGIEANDTTFDELLINQRAYQLAFKDKENPIRFEYGLAENYDVQKEDNLFYFFNPFSLTIFKQVIYKIKKSFIEKPRPIDIVIYYPIPAYVRYMSHTKFKLINKIKVPQKKDKLSKFRVYRLLPTETTQENNK